MMNSSQSKYVAELESKPLAAQGLKSYRCKGRFGFIMIGAKGHDDAMREALRSCEVCQLEDLEIWNGSTYEKVSL